MSRQVDVKALVSHIVRGDGADKCRICMGDTSEGQVFLGDTVMMDEDKPVTLSEIVESITGVEVPLDQDLPSRLCYTCSASAMAAAAFRTLCRQSSNRWISTVALLESLPTYKDNFGFSTGFYVVLEDNTVTIINKTETVKKEDKSEEIKPETKKKYGNDVKIKPMIRNKTNKRIKFEKTKLKVRKYPCPDCDKKFAFPKHLYEHFVDSTDLRRACFLCAAIMSRSDLIQHLKEYHGRQVYCCQKCPSLSFTSKQYKSHLERSHMRGAHHCGECGRRFPTNPAYNGHTSMHIIKHCPSCNKLFRNHRCYVHHVKTCCNLDTSRHDTHRTKLKVLFEVKNSANQKLKVGARGSADSECICDYCKKKFAGKKFVCAHIQIVHLKNTHRPCPYCGKSLAAAHMSQHIKSHEKMKLYTCKHCGLSLKTKIGFVQHLRLHSGEKPYHCQHCTETFSASSRRSEHIRKVHKTKDQIVLKQACELCPAKFRLPFSLRKHMRMVHENDNAQGQTFECPDCLIKFSSCRGMLYHRRTHQSVKANPRSNGENNIATIRAIQRATKHD